jgi:hypothetical protein
LIEDGVYQKLHVDRFILIDCEGWLKPYPAVTVTECCALRENIQTLLIPATLILKQLRWVYSWKSSHCSSRKTKRTIVSFTDVGVDFYFILTVLNSDVKGKDHPQR